MTRVLGILVLALLGAASGIAQTSDVDRQRQEAEARRQAEEARIRAEVERERQQPRVQPPVLRYPPDDLHKQSSPTTSPERRASSDRMFAEATDLERGGKGPEAVKMYMRAAREGNGKAAARLGEIYARGIPGVERDYASSLRWYNAARAMGEDVPTKKP